MKVGIVIVCYYDDYNVNGFCMRRNAPIYSHDKS